MTAVLVDTSIWADHFRNSEPELAALAVAGRAAMHPFVLSELAMGNLGHRDRVVAMLSALPRAAVIEEGDWLHFVERNALGGSGLGFVDAHLLASAAAQAIPLWTRDRRLAERATALGLAWPD